MLSDVDAELRVLAQQDELWALDKPSGLAVHGARGVGPTTVVSELRRLGLVGVHPVHRLDRGTSGVLLACGSRDLARQIGAQFEAGTVKKSYLALVRGVAPEHEHVEHAIPKGEGLARVPAATIVERLAVVEVVDSPLRERHYSWVRAHPLTGRFHQVRRHLKHLGHPIVGDKNYGRGEHDRFCDERFGLKRLALHSESLGLQHPVVGHAVQFACPIPASLRIALEKMGIAAPQPTTPPAAPATR